MVRQLPLFAGLDTQESVLSVAAAIVGTQHLTKAERRVLDGVKPSTDAVLVEQTAEAIRNGQDPLGTAYCVIHSPGNRRAQGQTFTPDSVIDSMLAWVRRQRKTVHRLVDPGAGSGRYTLAALRAFPSARAVAVEKDPAIALLLHANIVAAGFSARAEIKVCDYRELTLPGIPGRTLFIGNPPYVRHHAIAPEWKAWYSETLARFGYQGSQLAGLHLHFFLKTLDLAVPGDLGCFVTAAEWLDVKYGQALRQLLTNGLGGMDVFVVDPTVRVFDDALVSAAITGFSPGSDRGTLRFADIRDEKALKRLAPGPTVSIEAAKSEQKWSILVKGGRLARPEGFVELGEMFKVSRGHVTGLNRVWVQREESPELPSKFLVPAITDAADITQAANGVIQTSRELRKLVCLPRNLDELAKSERVAVERFLDWARRLGAHETYIARHRNPWWSIGKKTPPPVVMTYMGRRPPVFAINTAGAQLINVAHGLYPRREFSLAQVQHLVAWLNENVTCAEGRAYAGGLTKFEPSEAMRILVPEELT